MVGHVSAESTPLAAAAGGRGRRVTASARRMTSHRAIVDGVPLHWTEQGAGDPLIVLHGLGDSQHSWRAVTAELATRYRIFGLDLPGCGLSARPDASYGLDWQARTTASWLTQMGLEQHDVMGHSYGGGVALWLALHHGRALRRLALVAPGGLGGEVSWLLRLAAVCGALEAAGERLSGPLTRLLVELHGRTLPLADRRVLGQINSLPGTARAFARTVRGVVDWRGQTRQLFERANTLDELPVIGLFWGECDRIIPVRHARALCARLENCSLWQLPGAGHFLHWQAPRALARAVLGFLDAPALARARLRPPMAWTAAGWRDALARALGPLAAPE
jgi:pimeloyl-ACP methyl ester carboxylesterase